MNHNPDHVAATDHALEALLRCNASDWAQLLHIMAAPGSQFRRYGIEFSEPVWCLGGDSLVMRSPVYDLYQMKEDRLPKGARSAWLRTRPNEPPPSGDDWVFVGKERHPSKWTIAEMDEKGTCYREIPSWLSRRPAAPASPNTAESPAA